MYESLCTQLNEYREQKRMEWQRDVDATSKAKLNQPLLVRKVGQWFGSF